MRFEYEGRSGFGSVEGECVRVHRGELFAGAEPTGELLPLSGIRWAPPCVPSKFLGLAFNSRSVLAKQGTLPVASPFYFIKAPSSRLAPGADFRLPRHYDGRVVFEGELGIVIGQRAAELDLEQAARAIFGYTCVNDITALDLILQEPAQWTRAKSFDGFGPFGPVIATGLDPSELRVRTLVNGRERQNYPISDLIFSPLEIVSQLSRDLTLEPGDVIACGTSLGVGAMKPGTSVEIEISGIGVLRNSMVGE
ncbi:MAG TPA: fumarylacetoacetate hydrolase family protein [Polyangiaceae bacterium]|nr:fumarylacetoacetate hydrolase family protein [Polyangiaceae bacterium]